MKHLRWIGILPLLLMLLQTCCSDCANAQSAAAVTDNATNTAKDASKLIGKLDQLVEQNRRLEKQNQELMEEINALRRFLPKQPASPTAAPSVDRGTTKNVTTASNRAWLPQGTDAL